MFVLGGVSLTTFGWSKMNQGLVLFDYYLVWMYFLIDHSRILFDATRHPASTIGSLNSLAVQELNR